MSKFTTPPPQARNKVIVLGKLSTSQDALLVSPYGIAPCHTAGHGNCPKVLVEY